MPPALNNPQPFGGARRAHPRGGEAGVCVSTVELGVAAEGGGADEGGVGREAEEGVVCGGVEMAGWGGGGCGERRGGGGKEGRGRGEEVELDGVGEAGWEGEGCGG